MGVGAHAAGAAACATLLMRPFLDAADDLEPTTSSLTAAGGSTPLPSAMAGQIPLGASPAAQQALAAVLAAAGGGGGGPVGGGSGASDGGALRAATRKGGAQQAFELLAGAPGAGSAAARHRAVQTHRRGIRDLKALLVQQQRVSASGYGGGEGGAGGDGAGLEREAGEPDDGLGIDDEELAQALELQMRYDEGRA